jgi:hypothetical protein
MLLGLRLILFLPRSGKISGQIIGYLYNLLQEKMLCSTMFHYVVIFWNPNIKRGLTANGNQTSLAQVHLKYFFLSSAAIVKTAFH